MQRQVVSGGRLECTDAHRAGVCKLNRSFRTQLENPDVGNRGIENEIRAGAARVHGKLVQVVERNVRREIDRAVHSRQHQQVQSRKSQRAARRSGGNPIYTD